MKGFVNFAFLIHVDMLRIEVIHPADPMELFNRRSAGEDVPLDMVTPTETTSVLYLPVQGPPPNPITASHTPPPSYLESMRTGAISAFDFSLPAYSETDENNKEDD